jgi:hypothetical protein
LALLISPAAHLAGPGALAAPPAAQAAGAGVLPGAPAPSVSGQEGVLPYFPETGFRIANAQFADYFRKRGGLRTFGYPVSNGFLFLGTQVQFFQRQIMQIRPDGGVGTLNILDADLMPYTRINGSTFPAADPALVGSAPDPGAPNYAQRVLAFVAEHTPDVWNGLPVNFRQTFLNTVRYEEAFPNREVGPGIMPLINLEMWGIPTSQPAFDPNNTGFVYLRFQRGIMHYDAATGATQGLLLADYLKAILTGQNLPPDLEEQARGSRFYRQYDPSRPRSVARPAELPATDLTNAFGELAVPIPPTPAPQPTPQVAGPVPAEYQGLYDTLKGTLERFDATLQAQRITPHKPLIFAAELSAANCNNGPKLLEPEALDAVRVQLDALKRLGVQGATFCIHYPLLYPPFPNSSGYLAFYTAVAREVRARGMKLAIDSQVIFSGSAFAALTVDYSDLTFDVYADRKAQMAQIIIDNIAPDYLSLGGEPDTEARLTGIRDLADPARHTEFFQKVLAKVNRKTTKLGGGSGTWLPPEFVRSYAANLPFDFIDLHVYPVSDNIYRNTVAMADLAQRFNKSIVVYEAWLYKSVGQEAASNVAASEAVFARDVFDFWQPLDQLFIKNLVNLANWKRFEYLSFFWSGYFFAYQRYDPADRTKSPAQLLGEVARPAFQNMLAGVYTPTGEFYRSLIQANQS